MCIQFAHDAHECDFEAHHSLFHARCLPRNSRDMQKESETQHSKLPRLEAFKLCTSVIMVYEHSGCLSQNMAAHSEGDVPERTAERSRLCQPAEQLKN